MKLLVLLLLGSCAVGTYKMKPTQMVAYNEARQLTKLTENLAPLRINQVTDLRGRDHLGYAYTGVQYEKTPILLEEDISTYVKKYFEESLTQRNIKIDPYSQNLLDIKINHIWVEEVIEKYQAERAKCRVEFDISLKSANKNYSGNFWAEFLSAGDLRDGTERIAPTLASCMNNLIEKIVADNKLIDILRESSNE